MLLPTVICSRKDLKQETDSTKIGSKERHVALVTEMFTISCIVKTCSCFRNRLRMCALFCRRTLALSLSDPEKGSSGVCQKKNHRWVSLQVACFSFFFCHSVLIMKSLKSEWSLVVIVTDRRQQKNQKRPLWCRPVLSNTVRYRTHACAVEWLEEQT
jgi:hypothetical protein